MVSSAIELPSTKVLDMALLKDMYLSKISERSGLVRRALGFPSEVPGLTSRKTVKTSVQICENSH